MSSIMADNSNQYSVPMGKRQQGSEGINNTIIFQVGKFSRNQRNKRFSREFENTIIYIYQIILHYA